ncbi:MAG: hypothetical protein ABSH31_06960 [Bryobacteraceae bacterium]|jgi:hypothetical protein
MKISFALLALSTMAGLCSADSIGTYGDTTVVTGPDSNPAWQLTSDSSGPNTYSGVYLNVTSTLTPATLLQLSADYVMTTGTFDAGAPRFSIGDTTSNPNNEAYIYWGTPTGGGDFTDPNNGNTSYANTGNYADLTSSDIRVYSNGFGGYGTGNTGQTWAQFLADPGVGATQIGFISIDLDGGFGQSGSQVMDTTNFDINGVTYKPSVSTVPEPTQLGLMLPLFAMLGGTGLFLRRRKAAG